MNNINVNNNYIAIFRDKLNFALSPLQKKVLFVASAIFAGLTAIYLISRSSFFKEKTVNGRICEVDGKQTRFNGKLIYRNDEGITLKGNFHDNLLEGVGEVIHPDGRKLKGNFTNGKLNGPYTITLTDKTEVKNEFPDQALNDDQEISLLSGEKYKGRFENGQFKSGVYTHYLGIKFTGVFQDGRLFNGSAEYTHREDLTGNVVQFSVNIVRGQVESEHWHTTSGKRLEEEFEFFKDLVSIINA